jgi:hypothetical protein
MIWNDNYNDLYVILVTILITLNSITIPFSYSIVADKYKEYLDNNVYKNFLQKNEFKENIIWSFICLGFFLLPLLINVNLKDCQNYVAEYNNDINFRGSYLIVSVILLIIFIVNFVQFSHMIYKYVTNIDEVVFQQIQTDIDAYLSN